MGNRTQQCLVRINSGSSTLAGYAYDAFGRRVGKTRPGKPLQTFAYAGSQLLAENAGTPSHYAYLDGQPLARIDGSAANSLIYYFHNHPLGVPLKASNAAGQTVWAAQLQPFGLMQTTTTAISQNLRFPGQYFDAESGLHYNMARYYSPELGRYLQSDPIGLAGGINTYAYVGNNPVNAIDPLGLYETKDCSPKQEKIVKNACEVATKKAKPIGLGNQFQEMLDKATISCKPPAFFKDDCGANNQSSTIYLNFNLPSNRRSCNFAAITFHEGTHLPPLSFDEADAYLFEAIAFDTKPDFTPDQFNEAYGKFASDQLKAKYRGMYEHNFR